MTALFVMFLVSLAVASSSQPFSNLLPAALLLRGEDISFSETSHRDKQPEDGSLATCAGDEYNHPKLGHCCKKCLRGFKKSSDCAGPELQTRCVPCTPDTFTAIPNSAKNCRACSRCKEPLGQVVISKCTADKDTVCGCPLGQYQVHAGLSFSCTPCSGCQNGTELIPCKYK
ncbi:tumor necrosis factor receptor superfamily member 1A-like [Bombina bombina]|uniref:tumor necrosis factor receptor superfamily member 1A-like n=1 Tax=Bombina bombina TaxID=8345 RepID=UPI00235AA57C|nr:tumor necrosis factor receptor superfamily member 1A-like [Bombina bombina]